MRRKRTGIILIVIGVLLALGTGVLVFSTVATAQAQKPEPQTDIFVAAQDIPERTRITPEMIKSQKVNVSAVPPSAVDKRENIVDYVTVTPVFAGQPFYPSAMVTTTRESNVASAALEKGKVLVAINFSGASNILTAGAIRKGDTVDLIVKVPGPNGVAIATTMQNLKVYDIGSLQPSKADAGAPANSSPVFIFQVAPEEALELKFLETLSPDLVLRSAADQKEGPQRRPLIDMEYMANRYGLPLPRTGAATTGSGGAAQPSSAQPGQRPTTETPQSGTNQPPR